MLKIGVRLPRKFEDAGDYLADARALDAAGVDSLWLDDAGYEPWLLLAGVAAVTGRARLVVPVAATDGRSPASLRARVETLDRLSRGRAAVNVAGAAEDPQAVEGVIEVARRASCCVFLKIASERQARLAARMADGLVGLDESPEAFGAAVKPLGGWREHEGRTGPFELWAVIRMPNDREGWRSARTEYAAAGATGIIVPADARLLDLLRNGDEDDDRSDLNLAQG
jgi:alkanesulfonate monooxygenase SsuD/methylene tetrahydromethanopterin reductase-like flavin-dependent oxidoreductase (luciferase family)